MPLMIAITSRAAVPPSAQGARSGRANTSDTRKRKRPPTRCVPGSSGRRASSRSSSRASAGWGTGARPLPGSAPHRRLAPDERTEQRLPVGGILAERADADAGPLGHRVGRETSASFTFHDASRGLDDGLHGLDRTRPTWTMQTWTDSFEPAVTIFMLVKTTPHWLGFTVERRHETGADAAHAPPRGATRRGCRCGSSTSRSTRRA